MKKIAKIIATISAALIISGCTYNGTLTSKAVDLPASSGIYDGAKSTTVTSSYGSGELTTDNGVDVVHVVAGSWAEFKISLANKINAKDAKKMKIIARTSDTAPLTGGDVIVLQLASGDDSATCFSGWSNPTLFKDLAAGYQIYEVELNDSNKAGVSDQMRSWTADDGSAEFLTNYNITKSVDWSAISDIIIDPRGATGDIYIRDIIFE